MTEGKERRTEVTKERIGHQGHQLFGCGAEWLECPWGAPRGSGTIPGGSGRREETRTFGEPSFRPAVLGFPVGQERGYMLTLHIMAYIWVLWSLSSVHSPKANTHQFTLNF